MKNALTSLLACSAGLGSFWAINASAEPKAPEQARKPPKHDASAFQASLRQMQIQAGTEFSAKREGWTWLGDSAVAYASENWDSTVSAAGSAIGAGESTVTPHAHFNLANALYQRAKTHAATLRQQKEQKAEDLPELIHQLEECVEHYDHTLSKLPDHAPAAENKSTVEELIKKLKELQKLREQQQNQQKQQGEQGQEEQQENQEKSPGDQPKPQPGEKEGEKNPGQSQGGQGEGGKEKNGEKPKDGEKDAQTKEGESGDNKPKGQDQRSEDQKAAEEKARLESNKELEGKREALNQVQTKGAQESKDEKKNEKTGYSPSQVRRALKKMADDVSVRPEQERRQEMPFKNW
jgi:hypothetical protein